MPLSALGTVLRQRRKGRSRIVAVSTRAVALPLAQTLLLLAAAAAAAAAAARGAPTCSTTTASVHSWTYVWSTCALWPPLLPLLLLWLWAMRLLLLLVLLLLLLLLLLLPLGMPSARC